MKSSNLPKPWSIRDAQLTTTPFCVVWSGQMYPENYFASMALATSFQQKLVGVSTLYEIDRETGEWMVATKTYPNE